MEYMSAIDFPVIDRVNAVGGIIIAIATYVFGEHWLLFAAFLVLNVLDYFTGIFKAHMHQNENSMSGLKGVIKKLSYWILVALAFGLSPVLNHAGEMVGADIVAYTPFVGWFVLATLALNEFRSILENLVECGVAVPAVLIKSLEVAEKVMAKCEEKFDGHLEIKNDPENQYSVTIETSKEELEERDSVTLKIKTVYDEEDD